MYRVFLKCEARQESVKVSAFDEKIISAIECRNIILKVIFKASKDLSFCCFSQMHSFSKHSVKSL